MDKSDMPQLITAMISRSDGRNDRPHDYVHTCHVIGMLVSGDGYCSNGNVRSPAKTPWLTFLPEGRRDGNHLAGPFESRYVCFQWNALMLTADKGGRFLVDLQGFRQPVRPFVELDKRAAALCAGLIEEIRDNFCRQSVSSRIKAEEGLLRLIRTYLRLAAEEPAGDEHRELLHFRSLITQHAYEQVGLEELSRQCRLSSDHLGRLFKQVYGFTPVAYRTSLRMDRASDLLSSSNLNVSEVASRVGYSDPLYFSRAFRRHFGFPPSQCIRALAWPPRQDG